MNRDYVKLIVRRLYDAQKIRIQSDQRIQRLVREGVVPKEQAEEVFTKAKELEESCEREYERIVWREIRDEPIVTEWLIRVRGIGKRLAGLLVAIIGDVERFPTTSKLWAYAGLHVKDGRAVKREKGEKANWSAELKTTCWKIGKSFVKAGGPYRELYDTYKQYLVARELRNGNVIWGINGDGTMYVGHAPPEVLASSEPLIPPKNPEWTLGRIDAMATRRTVKIFLSHLWQVWWEINGKTAPTKPFVEERLGHTSIIDPWSMVEPDEDLD